MAHADGILERIVRELGGESVLLALRRLSPRDLNSLLLHLCAQRAKERTPFEILEAFESAPAFAPAFVEPRLNLRFMNAAFEAAPAFEAIELSPVCPLGTVSALSGIHQNNVLSASRSAEIVADPTPVLALECARRRRRPEDRGGAVRLCTSQRMVRMQPAPAGLLPHFRLFALVTAAQKQDGLEPELLREHLEVYLRLFAALSTRGFGFGDVTVSVAHTGAIEAWLAGAGIDREAVRRGIRTQVWGDPDRFLTSRGLVPVRGRLHEIAATLATLPRPLAGELTAIDEQVLAPLAAAFPTARFQLDLGRLEGIGYYTGPCARISACDSGGTRLPLVDGGYTDWTQRLLGDRRERFLITGIGSDLVCARLVQAPAGCTGASQHGSEAKRKQSSSL